MRHEGDVARAGSDQRERRHKMLDLIGNLDADDGSSSDAPLLQDLVIALHARQQLGIVELLRLADNSSDAPAPRQFVKNIQLAALARLELLWRQP